MATKRAIIYSRVSTDDQRSNFSIPTQIAECVKYCQNNGYTLVGNAFVDKQSGLDVEKNPNSIPAYVDDYSSREMNRPSLDAALTYLEDYGFDVVVVHSIDRLARDPYIRQTLEKEFFRRGAKVEFALGNYDDSPEGEVRKDMDATFAKWENAKRVERCNRGKRGKAEKGLYVGGRTPYGYILDAKGMGGLSIHPEQAEVVRLIFSLYGEENYSMHRIRVELENRSIPSYTGKPNWHLSAIRNILTNTAYKGYVHYNKSVCRSNSDRKPREKREWIKIEIAPLIDVQLFNLVQMRIKDHREALRRQPQHFYLLSGMIRCMECEKPYRANFQKDRPKEHRKAHRSYRHRRIEGQCMDREITAVRLEERVWEAVKEMLVDTEVLRQAYYQAQQLDVENRSRSRILLEGYYRSAGKLEQQLTNLTRAYTDPDIQMTKTEYLAQRVQLDRDLTEVRAKIEEIEAVPTAVPTQRQFEDLEGFAQKVRERIANEDWDPTPESKRQVLELLHAKVVLSKDGSGKVTGWFGETSGFSYTRRSHFAHPDPKNG